ncbi:type I-E CRISPR-associated protein Cas7/Cse4/CasC [Paraburkholderia sp. UCT31]|uniref:type I-E CRISPR-associated protein Cas7/Cse4/CasC n=1 Tax=Paraburkholderia sp. UCT31 TaxID=2615209 RepID=UPI001655CD66|nr:type I-E CRISPR-associated protein Cas7/Cse4/CasC [Paraburkholderia sp. UCT31]
MAKSRFLQLHFLTAFSANNLNRDDLSRPKSFVFGATPRLRISSQSIKRAWRISDAVHEALAGEVGVRSREMWFQLGAELVKAGHSTENVLAHIAPVREAFEGARKETGEENGSEDPADAAKGKKVGKKKPSGGLDALKGDLFYFSKSEREFIRSVVIDSLTQVGTPAKAEDVAEKIKALPASGDVAMFGRMVASNGALAIEGAVQVAHPFTVNKSVVDDDFFVAVDDLNEVGSGHMGSNGFGSGLYYGYVNVDLALLLSNLSGDVEKARKLLVALAEVIATVAPGGKQNSFAARSYASFLMAEHGNAQPRSFADAFLTPVNKEPMTETAISALLTARDSVESAFPRQATKATMVDRVRQQGSFADVEALICDALGV